jgi:glycosyltransferase involved in cell wall biosynthesis
MNLLSSIKSNDIARCVTYVRPVHDGIGWVENCVNILENFPTDMLRPTIVLPRTFKKIALSVEVKEAIPRLIPYRLVRSIELSALTHRFKRALIAANPQKTIAYFWPSPPVSLIHFARERGFVAVREMINTCIGTRKTILEEAYKRADLPRDQNISRPITEQIIAREREELRSYDYVFSPNPAVEKSLVETGVDRTKILRASFGWSPSKYAGSMGMTSKDNFVALFVGTIGVRKGIPQLLAAWKKSGVKGELVLAGIVEPSLKPLLQPYLGADNVRLAGFVADVGHLYKSADVLVFPTLEEGDPLVTYEAAGCGLPIITTSMGAANIIRSGANGLIVEPYDIEGLAQAISSLANSPELRAQLGQQAAQDAQNFTFEKVSKRRAAIMTSLLTKRVPRDLTAN